MRVGDELRASVSTFIILFLITQAFFYAEYSRHQNNCISPRGFGGSPQNPNISAMGTHPYSLNGPYNPTVAAPQAFLNGSSSKWKASSWEVNFLTPCFGLGVPGLSPFSPVNPFGQSYGPSMLHKQ